MSAQSTTLDAFAGPWHRSRGRHSRFITDNSAASSHGESLGLRECPACLADLSGQSVIEHIAGHQPEDFGLTPLGGEYDAFEPRTVAEIPGGGE